MLKASGAKLPFSAHGCFLSVHDFGEEYRVYLVDPAYLTPVDRKVRLKINIPGGKILLTDLITSDRIECRNGQAELLIPAGTLRAISVRVEEE